MNTSNQTTQTITQDDLKQLSETKKQIMLISEQDNDEVLAIPKRKPQQCDQWPPANE